MTYAGVIALGLGALCVTACGQVSRGDDTGGPVSQTEGGVEPLHGRWTEGDAMPPELPQAVDTTIDPAGCAEDQFCLQGFFAPVCADRSTSTLPRCGPGEECKSGICVEEEHVGRQCVVSCGRDGAPSSVDVVGRVVGQGVHSVDPLGDVDPLSHVTVCAEGRLDSCVQTDAEGAYALRSIANQGAVWLTYERDGYATARRYVGEALPADQHVHPVALAPTTSALGALATARASASTGTIVLVVVTPNLEEVTARVALGPPVTAGDLEGPLSWIGVAGATAHTEPPSGEVHYVDEAGQLDTTLEATSAASYVVLSHVPEGNHDIDVTSAAGQSCIAGAGAAYRSEGGASTSVRAGFVTTDLVFVCPP